MNGNGWELDHGNSAGVLNAADGFSLDEALNLLELFIERPDARRLFREEGGDVRLMEGPAGKADFCQASYALRQMESIMRSS